jgi:alpha-tubulin suppressor-like RCC1 family protein
VWVESFDKTGAEVIEYFEGAISGINEAAAEVYIKTADNEDRTIRTPILLERNPLPGIVEDLADIPILNDAELLKHLELRYRKNLIHSYCGPTLLIVNPYKWIDHEMSDENHAEIIRHLQNKTLSKAKPHIWTISSIAYEFMLEHRQNQAICISGESGSGKTESTKRCLEFITQLKSVSKSVFKVSVEDQILRCNPLLECLGNAKTQVNDNSSRFGKYTVLYIDKAKRNVRGASIQNYLLEKSRVTNLGKDERTYHIFYCMCRFMDAASRAKYLLNNDGSSCRMDYFKYLNKSSLFETPKINDEEFYNDVTKSLNFLEFSKAEQDAFWRTLSAVLYIGNIEVDPTGYVQGSKGCSIRAGADFDRVVTLLGVDRALFEKGLTYRMIRIGQDINWSPLTPEKVKTTLDTLARELYNRNFNWIIKRLNKTLFPKTFDETSFLTIGILDIFGFEIFKFNSLEQLFINFANERLQGLYIDYIFKNECKIFTEEGLGEYTSLIVYKDNKPVIDTLESAKLPPGVFDLLDQMSNTNKTDKEFFEGVQKAHKTSPFIAYPKIFKDARDYNFSIKHTARDVTYYVSDFVDKNTEELQTALVDGLKTAQEDVYGIFAETLCLPPEQTTEMAATNRKVTLSMKFRKSMDELIRQLASCNCHFVRCLKPNEIKKADFWNPLLVLQQIRYMGLLDSLKIRKNSFPFRYTYAGFFEIFQDLDVSVNGARNFRDLVRDNADFIALTKELLAHCGIEFSVKDLLFGKTKVFLNERLKIDLEKALQLKQKQKRQCLGLITTAFRTFQLKLAVRSELTRQANVITLSRDFLCSWGAKAEASKLRKFFYLVRRTQLRFRRVQQKRQMRLKLFNMLLIIKHLGLYKFNVKLQYLFYFKNKVKMLNDMLDRKMKESKIRFCRSIVERCINGAWSSVALQAEEEGASTIQRTFRAHLLRLARINDIHVLHKKIQESRTNNSAKTLQKMVRGFLLRRRLLRLTNAANKIKGFVRTRWIRAYFLRVRAAVRMIQLNLKKHFLRRRKIEESGKDFLRANATLVDTIRRLEHSILFGDQEHLTSLENVEDYTKIGFYEHSSPPDFGKSNYKLFVPEQGKGEGPIRLFALPIDLNVHQDTTSVYHRTWGAEFVKAMRQIQAKNKRLVHVEVGETFTVALTDENDVYMWGLNDFNQCAATAKGKSRYGVPLEENEGFYLGTHRNKTLSGLVARGLSAAKDHCLLVDEGNGVVGWGRSDQRQMGCDLKDSGKVRFLNHIPVSVKAVGCRERSNFVLSQDGKVYGWSANDFSEAMVPKHGPRKVDPQLLFAIEEPLREEEKPNYIFQLNFPETPKIASLSVGTDFALFLTEQGLVYGLGTNEFGQLGLGHSADVAAPALIQDFRTNHEKILEVSAGAKHFAARSNSGAVFTCGYNRYGQLGTGDLKNRDVPTAMNHLAFRAGKVAIQKVQAGFESTYLLFSNRQVWVSGRQGSDGPSEHHTVITRLHYETKVI